jgi:Polyketide cyclase / dehydrase and lipid transport
MLKKIALGLGAVVVILVAVVAMQPSSFTIERSAAIEAPADIVYGQIANLRAWEAWSPWARMDPQMKSSYAGPEAGVGAASSWEGPEAGKGRMTITAAAPDQEIDLQLEFLEPMQATNQVRFTLAPAGESTDVTWRMEGHNGFVGKAFALVMNMDELVGGDFERGLASLKSLAEADAETRRTEQAAVQAAAEAAARAAAGAHPPAASEAEVD